MVIAVQLVTDHFLCTGAALGTPCDSLDPH